MKKMIGEFRVVHSSGIENPGPRMVTVERYQNPRDTEEATVMKLAKDAQGKLKEGMGFRAKLIRYYYK